MILCEDCDYSFIYNKRIDEIFIQLNFAACINEYFSDKEEQEKAKENSMEAEDPIYNGYKAVLDSKSSDETLVSTWFIKSII